MARLKQLPPLDTLEGWRDWRHLARTDLFFLCFYVLGYTDVDPVVHGPLIRNLQQFDGGWDRLRAKAIPGKGIGLLKPVDGIPAYQPVLKMQTIDGVGPHKLRKTLNLISRGHLKTTIATQAHSIQWIINYPNVRILLSSGTGEQVRKFLKAIKEHFQFNERFRYLFPEFCPQGNVLEFGNQDQFTVPCRSTNGLMVKEPTVSTVTVGSVMAGGHFDVIKHDDVVDKENVRTPDQIALVENHIQMTGPLLERYNVEPGFEDRPAHGWVDFIGTIYHYADLYCKILEDEERRAREGLKPNYSVIKLPCIKDGRDLFDPKAEPLWPGRFTLDELKRIYSDPLEGGSMFISQYMLRPVTDTDGLVEKESDIKWIPKKVLDGLYARLALYVTIDLAGMENTKATDGDYTALTLAGFDRTGSMYVLEVIHGRPDPFEVIRSIFDLWKRHPRIREFKIEKEAHARTLLPFLRREMELRGVWLPVTEIKRDNQTSKTQKIKALQPYFKAGRIRFSEAIECKDAIVREIMRFPKWHDDILDTIRDQMDNADGGLVADAIPRPAPENDLQIGQSRFLGCAPGTGEPIWQDGGGLEDTRPASVDSMIGCL